MKKKKKQMVCFAGCDWWYHNRGLFCPQIMTRLVKDYKVLYVNSLGMRVPSFKKDRNAILKIFRKLRSIMKFLSKDENGMYVLTPLSIPYKNRTVRAINRFFLTLQIKLIMKLLNMHKPVAYVGCLPALEIVEKLDYSFMIYERTDIFTEMPGIDKEYIAKLDNELLKKSDLVLYVNRAMWKEGMKINKNSVLIGHGVDYEYFAGAKACNSIPEDIAKIPRPIVGFFGEISAKTSDLLLLEHIVNNMPDISLVMVGSISTDVNNLKKYDNVYFLGQKPYGQIADYGKIFDIAIMPWNRNRWIEFCNPVKIKEYLALGKPVVSMYYPEIEPYSDIVYIANDYEQFISKIKIALHDDDIRLKNKRKKRVQNETWDSKVEQIIRFIENGVQK